MREKIDLKELVEITMIYQHKEVLKLSLMAPTLKVIPFVISPYYKSNGSLSDEVVGFYLKNNADKEHLVLLRDALTGKYKFSIIKEENFRIKVINLDNLFYKILTQAKLVNTSDNTISLGYSKYKKTLIGSTLPISKVIFGFKPESLKGASIDVVSLLTPTGRNLKFDIKDLDFNLPDLKGFQLPKDRKFHIGGKAQVIDDRGLDANRGEIVPILDIIKVSNFRQFFIKDDILVYNNKKNKICKGYLRNFKAVNE